MDKSNKNRTDLLAAGRKKLQQFRQKKDGKGGKSSSKSNKSDSDPVKLAATSGHVVDGKAVEHNTGELRSSELDDNLVNVDNEVSMGEQSSEVDPIEPSSTVSITELPLEDSVMSGETVDQEVSIKHDEVNILCEGGSSSRVDKGVNEHAYIETSMHSDMPLPAEFLSQVEGCIPLEQVTDVGTMQDFSSSVPGQANTGSDILMVANDSNEDIKEAAGEASKISEPDKGFSSTFVISYADGTKDLGVFNLDKAQSSPEPLAITQVSGEQIKFTSGSSNDNAPVDRVEMKGDEGVSSGNKVDASTVSLGNRRLTLSSVSDSISLSQIAEMMEKLDDHELKFLSETRKIHTETLSHTWSFSSSSSDLFDVFERLKDHLYIMSFSEHTSQLQLAEELKFETALQERIRKMVVELSVASASLEEVKQRNEFLSEDLSQCRSQLQEVVCGRDGLTKQLLDSKADLEVLSSRVNDLENKLEMSQGNLAALTSELADCKNFAASLHTENESLNGRLRLVTEEKEYFHQQHDKLAVESEKYKDSLASLQLENANLSENIVMLRDEKMQIYEEKERIVLENEKLLSDLADLKELVEALQAENTNSNGVLKTVEEEKKNLEEVKEHYVLENEKLAADLMKSSSLVEALQTEISNINGNLASLEEERNKLHEEKGHLLNTNENLLQELEEAKIVMACQESEFSTAMTGLQRAKLWIEQLTEETIFLRTNLELHLAVMSRAVDITDEDEDFGDTNLINYNGSSLSSANLENKREINMSEKTSSERHAFGPLSGGLQLSDSVDLSELEFWKRNLEEADVVLQRLEKAIDELQSQLALLNTPNAKVKSPGVSKLIQAFELKSQTDDQETADLFPLDHLKTEDAYVRSKKCTENLKAFLSKFFLHAEETSKLIEGERGSRIVAEVKGAELIVHYESVRSDSDHLLGKNVELMVLYEALRQHVLISETRTSELVLLSEASQKQVSSLIVENSQLRDKLSLLLCKVSVFENQLDEISQSSEKIFLSLSNSVETLCKEVGERRTILEGEWNSFVEQIMEAVGKLDAFVENLGSFSSSTGVDSYIEIGAHTVASIDAAIGVIEAQHGHLKAIERDREGISNTYTELNRDFNNVREKKEMAVVLLDKIYKKLRKVVAGSHGSGGHETGSDNEKLFDPLDSGLFDVILQQLENLADEKMQLQFVNNKLNSDLMDRGKEIDELNKGCLDAGTILKCFEDVQHAFELDNLKVDTDEPLSYLQSLIKCLIQKYEEICLLMKNGLSNEMYCKELQEELKHLIFLHAQLDVENFVLRDSWKMVKVDLLSLCSELLEKVNELEQSEQRVSSLREKLSIAVTKGKGLVMQRDSLKQSLADTSNQLEIYSQELQLKDGRIHELEAKIKNFSEAGERMEALESELSYIRNSATALRESFLLKDSVLQRIEEILEELELPEQFHTRGIIEKVDWLAKILNGSMLLSAEWDQKPAVAAGSYSSDSGFPVVDGWKEEAHPNQNSVDEFRRRYEELQSKFFALAEQNEILEQSLMGRNNLVQRWEDILGRVDMPLQLRSSEPEDRIQWLGTALSEAEERCDSLQQRINHLDTLCGSLTRNLEESQGRILELESTFQSTVVEKELLLTNLEIVNHQYDEASKRLVEWESKNEDFLKEISLLKEDLDKKSFTEERLYHFEVEVRHMQDLIRDVLQNAMVDNLSSGSDDIKNLELLLKTLIEKYRALFLDNPVNLDASNVNIRKVVDLTCQEERSSDSRGAEDGNLATVNKELQDMLGELVHLKEERARYKEKNQSLVHEIEEFGKKNNELQQLLIQEENKSASLREKLNIAVKKGKSLVQQRDNMKQVIDEVSSEAKDLKYNMNLHEIAIAEYEQKIRNLTINQERIEATESECGLLRDRLAETEHHLQEKEKILNMMNESLKYLEIDVDFRGTSVENLEVIRKKCYDLRASLDSSRQESRKSKRAAELLLAELNEVQERNDGLHEELIKVAAELSQITREKALAEAAKSETFAQLEEVSALRSEERDQHLAEVSVLQSNMKLLRDDLSVINNLVADVLFKDLKILHDLEASIKSCMDPSDAPCIASLLAASDPGGIIFSASENKISVDEINSLKEMLRIHYSMLREEVSRLSEVVHGIYRDVASLKQVSRTRETDLLHLNNQVKEKDSQLSIMHRNISILHEACTVSIVEIENWKAHQARNALATDPRGAESQIYVDEANPWSGETRVLLESSTSEDVFRMLSERLLSVVKDVTNMQNAAVEHSQKEMKTVIMNLQKELDEKDIQREKISNEFVNQIKEAQGAVKSYLQDLQSAKAVVNHLQDQITVMEEERTTLENRVKELEDREKNCIDFELRIASLSDALAAKEQEAEAFMQALDEEESQLEEMSNKIRGLENSLRKKDKDIENLEASRGKVMKKLSITVNKFDELHQLSEHLLSEVEKLQSQLQERDGEISFLRQEVTRCTNEALTATQMGNKSDELNELLAWLDMMVSQVRVHDIHNDDTELNQIHGLKQILQNQVTSIISELEELRLAVKNTDSLLKHEHERVEELTRKEEFLEKSLHEKESQLILLKRMAESGQATRTASEIVEVEPGINKRATSATVAPQVRGGRKMNSDQVAIAIDMDLSNQIEDEDDDKAHGFKSLTTSRIIPRFTRPVTDLIDGLWVSCDRALMRQPALRLGVIIYWAILHALVATFVV